MALDVPPLDIDVPEITQIGLVVEDLEDGMDRFGAMLGIEPWAVYEFAPPDLTDTAYRGEEAHQRFQLAIATVGDLDVELIEPLEGENTYTDHLERHGEGLHHLACFTFDDPRGVAEELQEAGVPVEQRGTYRGSTFWYFDLRELMNGVLFEIVESGDEPPEPDRMYPPDTAE